MSKFSKSPICRDFCGFVLSDVSSQLQKSVRLRLQREYQVETQRAKEEADALRIRLDKAETESSESVAAQLREELHRLRREAKP